MKRAQQGVVCTSFNMLGMFDYMLSISALFKVLKVLTSVSHILLLILITVFNSKAWFVNEMDTYSIYNLFMMSCCVYCYLKEEHLTLTSR